MPQVSLYLDQPTMELVEKRAQAEKLSLSKYVSQVLKSQVDESWPSDFWELCGSISDATFIAPSRQLSAKDAPRASL